MRNILLTVLSAVLTQTAMAQASPSSDNIVINEVMAANVDVYRDPSTNYGSWVELYNPTDQSVTLGGLYVSDDAQNLKKHKLVSNYGTLPAKGFAILNFDHFEVFTQQSFRQIDDKLNCDGGTIIVSDGTTIFASMTYPAAISRISYARKTDGGAEWGLTGTPTPGATNATATFAEKQLAAPETNTEGKVFTGSVALKVTIPEGCTLRYTINGSTPTLTNGMTATAGSFNVTRTLCYRFRLFKDGMLPSEVVTRSFILKPTSEPFPVISVVCDPGHLLSGTYAIFSYSSYGRTGRGQTSNKYNANMEWDRPVNFEYFTTDGNCAYNQECDVSACGGWSRAFTPHSFKLKAGKQYGKNSFDYQFFSEKPFLKHKALQIRNGGNDNGCRIKDPAIQRIVATSGLYLEHQSWQPVHVYVNGSSYAVLNMREPNNKHYGYSNYGIDTDEMDQFEVCADSGYVQMSGTEEAFTRLHTLSGTAASEESYSEISKLLDIDEFINYMAVELFIGQTDWPQNNTKAFRDRNDGKFRFVLFDTDHALNTSTPFSTFFNKRLYTFDTLYGYDYSQNKSINNTRLTKEIHIITIFKNLLANNTFRKKFIDAFCLVSGSVFAPNRVKEIVTSMSNYLSQGGYVNPTSTANVLINGFSSTRQENMINELKNYSLFKLTSATAQQVSLKSNTDGASILLNGMEVPTGEFSGKLFAPITLTAKAPAGYKFDGWKAKTAPTTGAVIFNKGADWKYYDKGSLDNTTWKTTTYNDASWASGKSPIGYGKTQSTTTSANLLTYYFRKTINIEDKNQDDVFTLNYTIDDGMVVYVNGKEAGRYNMPSGTPTSSTVASTYAPNNPDTGTLIIDASLFVKGQNVIAVEVHNNSSTSSDILWDAQLIHSKASEPTIISTNEEYTLPTTGNIDLVACWTPVSESSLVDSCAAPIKINEVSAANQAFVNEYFKKDDWVELYNTTDTDIDVAGLYLSDNPSKPKKYQIVAPAQTDASATPVNTVIPAKGYLVVWCSKREPVNQLHASFKLGNDDGSVVVLSSSEDFVSNNKKFFDAHPQVSKEFADTLKYSKMNYDQSVGRFPDGANSYYLMTCSTIGRQNSMQRADSYVNTDVFTPKMLVVGGDANGDGMVSVADLSLMAAYVLTGEGDLNLLNADVNGDGIISVADMSAVASMILNVAGE